MLTLRSGETKVSDLTPSELLIVAVVPEGAGRPLTACGCEEVRVSVCEDDVWCVRI